MIESGVSAAAGDRAFAAPGSKVVPVALSGLEPVVRLGLAGALRAAGGVRVVDLDLGGPDLMLELALLHAPEVVLVGEGIEHGILARIKAAEPPPAVVVLLNDPASMLLQTTLLEQGVRCLPRSSSPAEIVAAVRMAARGQGSPPSRETREEAAGERLSDLLTEKEIEVLGYLREGRSDAYIARSTGRSLSTVRTHSTRIRHKLGVSRQELIG